MGSSSRGRDNTILPTGAHNATMVNVAPSEADNRGRANLAAWALVGLFLLCSILMVFVVPAGEAPDEPAHIDVINQILVEHSLPSGSSHDDSYEAHQPPLYYLSTAAVFSALGIDGMDYRFVPTPGFEFVGDGMPKFVEHPPGSMDKGRNAVRHARLVSTFYGLVFLVSLVGLLLCTSEDRLNAVTVAFMFGLSPQIVFAASTVNNDIGLLAAATLATLALNQVVCAEGKDMVWGIAAGVLSGSAIWFKASGVALAPAIVVVGIWLVRERKHRRAIALMTSFGIVMAAWLSMNYVRFGSLTPPLPTGWDVAGTTGWVRLVSDPGWVVSVWGSFWAKFGWFNLPLPKIAYLWFVVPSALVVAGAVVALRSLRKTPPSTLAFASIVGSNAILLLIYLAEIDWQPQGRYMFPSVGALAVFCAMGLQRALAPGRRSAKRIVAGTLMAGSAIVCLFSVWLVHENYALWFAALKP